MQNLTENPNLRYATEQIAMIARYAIESIERLYSGGNIDSKGKEYANVEKSQTLQASNSTPPTASVLPSTALSESAESARSAEDPRFAMSATTTKVTTEPKNLPNVYNFNFGGNAEPRAEKIDDNLHSLNL